MATQNTSRVQISSGRNSGSGQGTAARVAGSTNLGNRTAEGRAQASSPSARQANINERQTRSFNAAVSERNAQAAQQQQSAQSSPAGSSAPQNFAYSFTNPSSGETVNPVAVPASPAPQSFSSQGGLSGGYATMGANFDNPRGAPGTIGASPTLTQYKDFSQPIKPVNPSSDGSTFQRPLSFAEKTEGKKLLPSGTGLQSNLVNKESKTGEQAADALNPFVSKYVVPPGVGIAAKYAGKGSDLLTGFSKNKVFSSPYNTTIFNTGTIKGAGIVLKAGSAGLDKIANKPIQSAVEFGAGNAAGKLVVAPILGGARNFIGGKTIDIVSKSPSLKSRAIPIANKAVKVTGGVSTAILTGVGAYQLASNPKEFGESIPLGIGIGKGISKGLSERPVTTDLLVGKSKIVRKQVDSLTSTDVRSPTGKFVAVKGAVVLEAPFTAKVYGKPVSGYVTSDIGVKAVGTSPSLLTGSFERVTTARVNKLRVSSKKGFVDTDYVLGKGKRVTGVRLNLVEQFGAEVPSKQIIVPREARYTGSGVNQNKEFFPGYDNLLGGGKSRDLVPQVRGQENARVFKIQAVTPVAERTYPLRTKTDLTSTNTGYDFIVSKGGIKGGELYRSSSLTFDGGKVGGASESLYQRRFKNIDVTRTELLGYNKDSPILGRTSYKSISLGEVFGAETSKGGVVSGTILKGLPDKSILARPVLNKNSAQDILGKLKLYEEKPVSFGGRNSLDIYRKPINQRTTLIEDIMNTKTTSRAVRRGGVKPSDNFLTNTPASAFSRSNAGRRVSDIQVGNGLVQQTISEPIVSYKKASDVRIDFGQIRSSDIKINTKPRVVPITRIDSITKQRSTPVTRSTPVSDVDVSIITRTDQIPVQRNDVVQRSSSRQSFSFRSITAQSIRNDYSARNSLLYGGESVIPPAIVGLPPIGGFGSLGRVYGGGRVKSSKQRKFNVPSLTAAVFGLRGKFKKISQGTDYGDSFRLLPAKNILIKKRKVKKR